MREKRPFSVFPIFDFRLTTGAKRPFSRAELANLFWPELDTARSRRALRRTLSALRRTTTTHLWLTDRERIGLRCDEEWLTCDLWLFDSLMQGAGGHPEHCLCADCCHCLETAVSLHAAPFLQGFDLDASEQFDTWHATIEQQRQTQLEATLQRLTVTYRRRGELAKGMATAQQWLRLNPFAEMALRELMQWVGQQGDTQAVRHLYTTFVNQLRDQTRANPEPETVACYEALLAQPSQPWQLTLAQTARLEGMQRLLRVLLRAQFGDLPPAVIMGIEQLADEEAAIAIAKQIPTAVSPHDLVFLGGD